MSKRSVTLFDQIGPWMDGQVQGAASVAFQIALCEAVESLVTRCTECRTESGANRVPCFDGCVGGWRISDKGRNRLGGMFDEPLFHELLTILAGTKPIRRA